MMKHVINLALAGIFLSTALTAAAQTERDWATYGQDKGGQRFSPLIQITPDNVERLAPVWRYELRTSPPADPSAVRRRGTRGNSQITPLVVDGVMYLSTLSRQIVALDAASGRTLWTYEGQGPTRALEYWAGNGRDPAAILYNTGGGLVSLNAKTGVPNRRFGGTGVLMPNTPGSGAGAAAPVLVAGNILISNSDPYGDGGRPEDIRAFDVVTGRQLWRFNTLPLPGEAGHGSWPANYADHAVLDSSISMWGQPTVDTKRGLLYVLFDSPQWERWGGDRAGNNLFGNSLVALDLKTGKYRWHYQVVHHDLWDLDLTGQPLLFDLKRSGKSVPAVAVVGKPGLMFMFDRATGKPLQDIVETPVAQPNAPGEAASPTQPIPVRPVGLARTHFAETELAQVTPEHTAACKKMIADYGIAFGGPYNPPGFGHPTVNFPGANGAGNYGGITMNPNLGYIFVNTQDLGQITQIGPRNGPRVANGTTGRTTPASATHIPYDMVGFNGRFATLDPIVMPCQAPPWGRLSAVNAATGEVAWQVPLGVTESLPPGQQATGRPNLGGAIATASGLVFIGASDDGHFRAFDARTGATLWDVKLGAPAVATPVTFADRNGRQYVAITAGPTLHVFALQEGRRR